MTASNALTYVIPFLSFPISAYTCQISVRGAHTVETLPIRIRRGEAEGCPVLRVENRSVCTAPSRSAAGTGDSSAGDDGCVGGHATGESVSIYKELFVINMAQFLPIRTSLT